MPLLPGRRSAGKVRENQFHKVLLFSLFKKEIIMVSPSITLSNLGEIMFMLKDDERFDVENDE